MRFLSFIFLTVIALVSLASAQNSGLHGQVVDELGAAIPNAEVNLVGSDGKQRTTKSNANGEFAFPNVPPGVYTLTSAYKGFQTHVQEGVKVPTALLKVVMTVATVNEAVETKADEGVSVEPDQNMTATVLGEEFIQNLPDNEDDLRDYLQALAGPAAGATTGGQGGADILIDGFSGGHLPPREAIQQIKINNSPFSAEYQNPGYSRVEIITKPGFGDWRGGGGIGIRNASLDARNPFLDPKPDSKPDFSQQRYNFNLGGPIIKKKMSFFMYGDRTKNSGDGISKAITLEDTNSFTLVPSSSENTNIGLRTDYLLNDKNTLNLGYNYGLRKNLDNEFLYRFGGGFGGAFGGGGSGGGGGNNLFLPERGTDSRNSYHNLRIGETWIVNTNLINEMHMQYSHENSTTSAISPGQSINVLDSFYGGGVSYSDPTQTRSDEIEVHNYLTYTHKRHTIKGGLQFTHLFNRDFNENNFLGTYTFANLNEYQTALANMGTPLARAQTFTISSGDPYLFYRRYTAGLFLQDDFRMSQRLTISFGLREEFQSQLRDKNNWSPRFGFAWSPFSNRKTSIRGGAGLFYNRLSDGSYENTLRYDGVTQTNTIIRNALYPDPFAVDPSATSQISSLIPTVYKLDPNLKASYTINYNLSVEQQLPRGLIATLSFIHVDGVHLLRLRDINAPFPGTEQRPNPAEGSIYDYESTGRSTFDGFFFGFNRRISQRLTFFANYGLSWAHSDTGGLPANNYDLHSEWGRSSSDRRHNFSTIVNLNLPHGFRLNPVVNAFSGAPFNITTGVDENGDFQLTDRPAGINRNADLPASLYSSIPDRLICQPGTTPFRSAGGTACNTSGNPQMPILIPQMQLRDFLAQYYPNGVKAEGPGNFNVNMYLSKTIGFGKRNSGGQLGQGGGGRGGRGGFGGGGGGRGGLGGGPGGGGPFGGGGENARVNVTFTLGVTNLFNHLNYGQDGGTLGAAFFGIPSSANPPRQFDFMVRFGF